MNTASPSVKNSFVSPHFPCFWSSNPPHPKRKKELSLVASDSWPSSTTFYSLLILFADSGKITSTSLKATSFPGSWCLWTPSRAPFRPFLRTSLISTGHSGSTQRSFSFFRPPETSHLISLTKYIPLKMLANEGGLALWLAVLEPCFEPSNGFLNKNSLTLSLTISIWCLQLLESSMALEQFSLSFWSAEWRFWGFLWAWSAPFAFTDTLISYSSLWLCFQSSQSEYLF